MILGVPRNFMFQINMPLRRFDVPFRYIISKNSCTNHVQYREDYGIAYLMIALYFDGIEFKYKLNMVKNNGCNNLNISITRLQMLWLLDETEPQ